MSNNKSDQGKVELWHKLLHDAAHLFSIGEIEEGQQLINTIDQQMHSFIEETTLPSQPVKEDNKVGEIEQPAVFFGRMVDETKNILRELKLLRVLKHYGFESVEDAISKVDNLPPVKEDKESVLTFEIEVAETYYPVKCDVCGWMGSSEKLEGGHALADTGDYGDCYCPVCGNTEPEETEQIQPITAWKDAVEKMSGLLKKALQINEDNHWKISGIQIDYEEKLKQLSTHTVLTEEQLEEEIEQLFENHTDGAVGLTESIKKGVKDFVITKMSFPNHLAAEQLQEEADRLYPDLEDTNTFPVHVRAVQRNAHIAARKMSFLNHVTAEHIWEAAEKRIENDNDCSCGKCDYCTEVKPNEEIPPDKQTVLLSLNLKK